MLTSDMVHGLNPQCRRTVSAAVEKIHLFDGFANQRRQKH